MLVRIGERSPNASELLTSPQTPLHENSRAPTTAFRGVYGWTRAPMGLLPSAILFQKSMSYFVFREPLYQICEVYIDDILIYETDDETFVENVCTIFQKCR